MTNEIKSTKSHKSKIPKSEKKPKDIKVKAGVKSGKMEAILANESKSTANSPEKNKSTKRSAKKIKEKKSTINDEKKVLGAAIEKLVDDQKNIHKHIPEQFKLAVKEIYKHIHYMDKELNSNSKFNEEIVINFIKNIKSVGESYLHIRTEKEKLSASDIITLDNNKILKKTDFGWLCIHSLNVDVAPGILRDGIIEPWNKRILERILRSDDNFLNIGANFGFFSILGASIVGNNGKVIAIEANPSIYECLSYGIFYSGYPQRIDMHNVAASDSDGVIKLQFSPVFSGGGSIINNINYNKYPTLSNMEDCRIGKSLSTNKHFVNGDWAVHSMFDSHIPAFKIDTLFEKYYQHLNDLRLIQIDVEGAEKLVLDGSQEVISKYKPFILVEFDPHTVNNQVKEIDKNGVYDTFIFIQKLNYRFFKVNTNNNFEFHELNIPGDLDNLPHCDILLIPNSEFNFIDSMNLV